MPQKKSKRRNSELPVWAWIIIIVVVIVALYGVQLASGIGHFPSLEAKFIFYHSLARGFIIGSFVYLTYALYQYLGAENFVYKIAGIGGFYVAIVGAIKAISWLFRFKMDFRTLLEKTIKNRIYSNYKS